MSAVFECAQETRDHSEHPNYWSDAEALTQQDAEDQARAEWLQAPGVLLDTLRNLDDVDGAEPLELEPLRRLVRTQDRELTAGEALVLIVNGRDHDKLAGAQRLAELIEAASEVSIADRASELLGAA